MTVLKIFTLILSLIAFGMSCFALGYLICISSINKRVQKINNELENIIHNLESYIKVLTFYAQELEERAGLEEEELKDLYIQSLDKCISEIEQFSSEDVK